MHKYGGEGVHEDNLNEAKFARCRTAAAVSAFTDTELQYQLRPDLEFRQGRILQTLDALGRRIRDTRPAVMQRPSAGRRLPACFVPKLRFQKENRGRMEDELTFCEGTIMFIQPLSASRSAQWGLNSKGICISDVL